MKKRTGIITIICIIFAIIIGGVFVFMQTAAPAAPVAYIAQVPIPSSAPLTAEPYPEPEPTPEPESEPPINLTATLTTLTLRVNEKKHNLTAYIINGASYFCLYDIAYALMGTEKEFDSSEIDLPAYNINGTNRFKFRDIANAIGFRSLWVQGRDTILIDTDPDYIPAAPVFKREPLPEHIIELITGRSFGENTVFSHCFLTYLTVTHVDFNGDDRLGHIIVADEIGDEVLEIFKEIYEAGFPIYRMRLIDFYGADDYYSMADNNSVGFNFRYIAGTRVLSRHAFGMAIDINPIQNPFIRGDIVWPEAGREYLDRSNVRPGMIVPGDAVYTAFTDRGWTWGGNWLVPIDYHHFERR